VVLEVIKAQVRVVRVVLAVELELAAMQDQVTPRQQVRRRVIMVAAMVLIMVEQVAAVVLGLLE